MVYVDTIQPVLRSRKWRHDSACHLLADKVSELREFAERIGLDPEWMHISSRGIPHYDLVESKRRKAVELGATQIEGLMQYAIILNSVERVECESGDSRAELLGVGEEA